MPNQAILPKRITKEQRRLLNALLNVYGAYKDLVALYLEDVSKSPGDLDVLYIRGLVPEIRGLVGKLRIDVPEDFIPFKTLSHAGFELLERGISADGMLKRLYKYYGDLKLTADQSKAFGQDPIPTTQEIISETRRVIDAIRNGVPVTAEATPPRIQTEGGWINITFEKNKPIRLFEETSLYGALLSVLGDPWGIQHAKDVVLEDLAQKTRKQWTPKQIEDASKELNRRMKSKGVPPIKIVSRENTWQIVFK